MRLTLRTLLSYLDNVLDEPSRKALEEQIEKGENASEWVHRTRDVMRRLKLGAPELHGSGSVDDPNTVAEYLDRTLPEEGVAEFERVCLESDVMLAEVASCHHVLAMVLSEQAAIDPDTRKRLHRLQEDLAVAMKSRIEAAHPSHEETTSRADPATSESAAAESQAGRRVKPETVPSYLQESDSSDWMRWLPALAALLLLAVISAFAFGPGGWLNKPKEVAQAEGEDSTAIKETSTEQTERETQGSEVTDPEPTPTDNGEETAEASSEDEQAAATAEEAGRTETESDKPDSAVASEVTAEKASAAAGEAGDAADQNRDPLTADGATEAGGSQAEVGAESEEAAAAPEPAAAEPKVTPTLRSLSGPEQLAVFMGPDSTWQRLQGGLATEQESRVICMPTYRSAIGVAGEFIVEMVGLTDAVINPQTSSVAISYGRVLIKRLPEADGPYTVELVLEDKPERHRYQIELSPGSILAVAADRVAEPGFPVLQQTPPLSALAQVIVAPVSYSRSEGGGAEKTEPGALFTRGRFLQLPSDYGDMEWVDELKVSVPDGIARPMLAQEITFGSPVKDQAGILAREYYAAEARSLAARCSLAVGEAAPLARSFQNEADADYWTVNFVALRRSAARSLGVANQVLQGLVEIYDNRGGATLFDLIQGFSEEQVGITPAEVSAGIVQTALVGTDSKDDPGLLDSNHLPTRALASLVLDELVIQEGQPYDPLARSRLRARSLRLLRQALEREELQPKQR